MRSKVRTALLVIVALLVVASAAATVALYPYYRMPEEGKDQLKATLAEYQALADDIAARPDDDRREFAEMLEKMAPMLKIKFEWRESSCPPKDVRQWKKHELKMPAVPGFDRRLDEIVAGGFVLRQDITFGAEQRPFEPENRWFGLEALLVVRQAEEGKTDEAVARLAKLATINNGIYGTPTIMNVMRASNYEMALKKTTLHILPRLNAEQLQKVDFIWRHMPAPLEQFIIGLKLEVPWLVQPLDSGRTISEDAGLGGLVSLATKVGYLKREKWMIVALWSRQIRAMEKWLADGAQGAAPFVVADDLKYSPLSTIAMINIEGPTREAKRAAAQREALLQLVELEKKLRGEEGKRPEVMNAGGFGKVMFEQGHYCLVD